jgi:hypothetical protein
MLFTRAFGAFVPRAQGIPLAVVGLAIKFTLMRRTPSGCLFLFASGFGFFAAFPIARWVSCAFRLVVMVLA